MSRLVTLGAMGRTALVLALSLPVAPDAARAARPAAAPPSALPAIDIRGHLEQRSDEFVSILRHSQVACLLSALMPASDVDALGERMHVMQGRAWLETLDADGGYSFGGWIPHAARCERGILWLHPDGRVFVAIWRDCSALSAFTNDDALATTPPAAVVRELASIREAWSAWPSDVPVQVRVHGLPDACSVARQREAMELAERRSRGEICDGLSSFAVDGAVVLPREGGRTPLRREPPCVRAGASRGRRPCVVTGDVVRVAQSRGDCTCAAFDGPRGTVTGWIDSGDLVRAIRSPWDPTRRTAVPVLDASAVARVTARLPPSGDFTGQWRDGASGIDVTRGPTGELLVFGQASHGYNMADLEGRLEVDGRVARFVMDDDPEACRLEMLLVNDALVVADDMQCGGYGVTFTGHYRRDETAAPVERSDH